MIRQSVNSSNIRSIGYDEETRTLEVEFHYNNSIYQYYSVPESVHRKLMNASSHGTYFDQKIKNQYRWKKIS